jgi:hypothetical protein
MYKVCNIKVSIFYIIMHVLSDDYKIKDFSKDNHDCKYDLKSVSCHYF